MRDKDRLEHILSAVNEILLMTTDGSVDRKTELAVSRLIEIIGEAAHHVSPELKAQYPGVPWSKVIGMRNALIHEYFRVSNSHLWDAVHHKIPALRDWIQGILEALEEKQ